MPRNKKARAERRHELRERGAETRGQNVVDFRGRYQNLIRQVGFADICPTGDFLLSTQGGAKRQLYLLAPVPDCSVQFLWRLA